MQRRSHRTGNCVHIDVAGMAVSGSTGRPFRGDARFDGATLPENAWFDEAIFAGAERVRWAGANSYVVDVLARMKACQRYSTRQNS